MRDPHRCLTEPRLFTAATALVLRYVARTQTVRKWRTNDTNDTNDIAEFQVSPCHSYQNSTKDREVRRTL